ncbi:MAG: LacI family DNA-binding transcriptional regulator [Clostridiales bacterium]|nr:LacI family DNA-binding transcriptional regulator [Clostridiales bacterium]
MITMTEIARLTGVSQPTVSRVLNGNKAVNPDIRERVLACAREHGFQPNVMAQSLVGSRTHLIGVVLTDISNPFFADLVKYLEQEAKKEGYSLILFNSNYDMEKEKECLEVVQRYRVDGLIAVPVDEDSPQWRTMIRHLDMPTVVLTRNASGMDSVYVAHDDAGAQVGRHLCEEGFDEFLFFGNTEDIKYQGFVDALAKERTDFRRHLSILRTKDSHEVRAYMEEYFRKTAGRTGIFAYNDRRAIQMMGILQQLGIHIPEQAGVVGFDNTYMCEYLYPKLSSVSQPNEEMAAMAVQRLLYRIDHPEEQKIENRPLKAKLMRRGSSARERE